jgi:hypothetical protein
MTALSPVIVDAFCRLCNGAYEGWSAHCALFPKQLTLADIKSQSASNGLVRLSIVSQEHLLHEICKLHDPAVQQSQVNLGIDYVVRFGGWDDATKRELLGLQTQLDALAAKLRKARNKILSHNDLETILEVARLGQFPDGEDVEYFKNLQKFVNIVHHAVYPGDFIFNKCASDEAAALLSLLKHD